MTLYTLSEYDDIGLGEPHTAQAYRPRLHRYVTVEARTITAPSVHTAHTGDEQLEPENIDRTGYNQRTITMHIQVDRKRKAREQRIIAYLRTLPDQCASVIDLAPIVGCSTETLHRMSGLSDILNYEKRGKRAYLFLAPHD